MRISKQEIIGINQELGGHLINDASIEFALNQGASQSLYKQIALLLRAIVIDDPFSDLNKRTAFIVTLTLLKRNQIKVDDELKKRIEKKILKLAKRADVSIVNLERGVRYAVEGH